MRVLLAACPSFEPVWAITESDNLDDSDPHGRLLYLDAGEFLRHLGALQLAGSTDEFGAVFDVFERFVVEGDDYVVNLGVIGFLEGFQMMTITDLGIDPEEVFRTWLRPVSMAWWKRINRFWAGEVHALQATAEQMAAEAHTDPDSRLT